MNPLEYMLGGVIAMVIAWGSYGHMQSAEYKELYTQCVSSKSMITNNYVRCDLERNRVNNEIESQRVYYEKKLSEREVITVEKIIPKYITLDKGDCNETKTVLDFIRNNHP